MSPITTGATVPPKSRTFKESDAKTAAEALKAGTNVGFGDFTTAAAARSAGNSLNKMMADLGLTDKKYATTVFAVDVPDTSEGAAEGATVEKHRGVMLPKDAKAAPAKKSGGKKK